METIGTFPSRISSLDTDPDFIVGASPAMKALLERSQAVARRSCNVLIYGESGSGKEILARWIHRHSDRHQFPFVPVNCTAIPETLLESELFGHRRGSFTGAYYNKKGLFEEADGGTLFLDEIGDLDRSLQAKLLRVLQDKQVRAVGGQQLRSVDVRIITATHRDLRALVQSGAFREDLYYRLNVIPLRVPPLRERREDIPELVEHFLKRAEGLNGERKPTLSDRALDVLTQYEWPGNIRELENIIERVTVFGEGELLNQLFTPLLTPLISGESEGADADSDQTFASGATLAEDRPTLEKLEERYIRRILREENFNGPVAAKVLGVSRRTLYRKKNKYCLF